MFTFKVVEVIEAINVFINGKYNNKCYFILRMDAEMVAAALDVEYEKMKGRMGSKELEQGSIGWYFLDKFIQLPFFIPVMSETKKKEYLKSLLTEKEKQENLGIKTETKKPNHEKVANVYTKVMTSANNNQSSKAIADADLTKEEEKELDKMILQNQVQLTKHNEEIQRDTDFDKWLQLDFHLDGKPIKIKDLKNMPWLKSRNMFKILMNELSEEAKFKNALDCNVW